MRGSLGIIRVPLFSFNRAFRSIQAILSRSVPGILDVTVESRTPQTGS